MILLVLNSYTMTCPSEREIIHSLKLTDYLLAQADNHGITITYMYLNNNRKYITMKKIFTETETKVLGRSKTLNFLLNSATC